MKDFYYFLCCLSVCLLCADGDDARKPKTFSSLQIHCNFKLISPDTMINDKFATDFAGDLLRELVVTLNTNIQYLSVLEVNPVNVFSTTNLLTSHVDQSLLVIRWTEGVIAIMFEKDDIEGRSVRNEIYERFQANYYLLREKQGPFLTSKILSTLDTQESPYINSKDIQLVQCPPPENIFVQTLQYCTGQEFMEPEIQIPDSVIPKQQKHKTVAVEITGWLMFGGIICAITSVLTFKCYARCKRRNQQRNLHVNDLEMHLQPSNSNSGSSSSESSTSSFSSEEEIHDSDDEPVNRTLDE